MYTNEDLKFAVDEKIFTQNSVDIKNMKKLAEQLASRVLCFPEGGQVIILKGEVGAGKTTFSRFFSEYLGLQSSSPTYSIIELESGISKNHENKHINIIHADFYRASKERSVELLDEYLEKYIINSREDLKTNSQNIYLLEWISDEMKQEFFYEQNISTIEIEFIHNFTEIEKVGESRDIEMLFKNPKSISVTEAKKLQDTYITPLHVREHIELVRKIAVFCAQKLEENNVPIDVELVESGAILHDCVRYVDFPKLPKNSEDFEQIKFYTPEENITNEKCDFWAKIKSEYRTVHHAYAMQDILDKINFEASGQVVKSHYTGDIFRKEKFCLEEICVYYADKRALHDEFVTIQERLIDGEKRYPHEEAGAKQNKLLEKILYFEKLLQELGNWSEEEIQKLFNNIV
ncbi:TPA: tRNA (adenosine(37)-N6)-threonylcarbamoyltransferase complex ATPase subunit type 1 TsaE [Candidatus Gracilibacteria bacterium]|nr:tRNA (adenosine(37)-N6)-threonylcarbamoyltransferase complex ATPase subunit type 1 TsaE [Candidatus Gracilibacteria bacterium]